MPEFSVSTWSLHRALGAMYSPSGDAAGSFTVSEPWGPGDWSLLDVPAECARRGIRHLEICHFHFPQTDEAYLAELKGRIEASGVSLFSILIDSGDITNPDEEKRRRDLEWIRGWIDIAGRMGAKHVRIIAGDAAPDDAEGLRRSVSELKQLAEYAESRGVRVMTENFHKLTSRPDSVNHLLDELGGRVGLCADFGNFGGPTKYNDLAAILPRAESVHAKANFSEGGDIDRDDFDRCLKLAREARFAGPYTLIFEGPQNEWEGVSLIKEEILASSQA